MTKKRPKTTDALMRYLREEKGILLGADCLSSFVVAYFKE